jgi:hypothetical protein
LRRILFVCMLPHLQIVGEAKIPVLSLGTEGGGSQWCNRLPEVMMISVADFCL